MMGYFPNNTEAELYKEIYCYNCIHWSNTEICPVEEAHLLHNYNECNNKSSILHILIPRDANGINMQCKMFIRKMKT